jgi:protein-S-isoprenylcysteine O-methyltransferase Ste14
MTVSSSTPRIRLTQVLYVAVLLVVVLTHGRAFGGASGVAVQATGFVLVVAGTLWRMWASLFIAGRKDVQLVDAGPYARCRHPLYFGSLVAALGLGLGTRSVTLTIAVPLAVAVLAGLAIRREERTLADHHGAAWQVYRSRVPALWPRSGRIPATARREVDVAVYFKAFLDAATMFGLWLLVVALDALRSLGLWSAPFILP